MLIERYKLNLPELVKTLEEHEANVRKILEIKVSDEIKHMDPEVYKDFKDKVIIIMIKAVKINE